MNLKAKVEALEKQVEEKQIATTAEGICPHLPRRVWFGSDPYPGSENEKPCPCGLPRDEVQIVFVPAERPEVWPVQSTAASTCRDV